jgi:hypothetical protein
LRGFVDETVWGANGRVRQLMTTQLEEGARGLVLNSSGKNG